MNIPIRVPIRVRPEDAARYRERAAAAGTTLADLARAAWEPPTPPSRAEALDAVERHVDALRGDPMHRQAVTALAQLRQALR